MLKKICLRLWHVITVPAQRRLFFKLLVIYLVIAIPFKTLELLPNLAHIRPNSALIPVYGFLYGPVGAWVNSWGSFLYDIITNSLTKSTVAGNVANFIIPLFMYYMWRHFVGTRFQLTCWRELGWYCLISILGALLKVLLIAPVVEFFYPSVNVETFEIAVAATEIVFYLVPGIAILILLQNMYGLQGFDVDDPEEATVAADGMAEEK
jgi:energy-coupling factor transport system substrate-specific component